MKIYLVSSWHNIFFDYIFDILCEVGHNVYNFKNPETCFDWTDIDSHWESWTLEHYKKMISDNKVIRAHYTNKSDIEECDVLVLLLPCGNSAHIEFGYAAGLDKRCYVLQQRVRSAVPDQIRPELMYMLGRDIFDDVGDLIEELKR